MNSTTEAIDRVEKNSNQDWSQAAYLACCLVAEQQVFLTSDDVWEMLATIAPQYQTHEPRAMGAVMRRVARDKKIEPTDRYVKSNRPECHHRPQMIWDSLIFEVYDF
jgi:hypothetical protein